MCSAENSQLRPCVCFVFISQYSSKRVLVMERLRGTSLIDLEGIRKYTRYSSHTSDEENKCSFTHMVPSLTSLNQA